MDLKLFESALRKKQFVYIILNKVVQMFSEKKRKTEAHLRGPSTE